jgi:hypothetical protein
LVSRNALVRVQIHLSDDAGMATKNTFSRT